MSEFISVRRVIDTVIYRHKYFSLITFTLKPRIPSLTLNKRHVYDDDKKVCAS